MELFEYIDQLNQPYDIFYTDSINSPLHWHYYCEILYMMEGTLLVVCNDTQVILHPGDLCYIYPLQLHEMRKWQHEKVKYAVLKFDIHTINIPHAYLSAFYGYFSRRTADRDFCLVLRGNTDTGSALTPIIQKIVSEYEKKEMFYALQVQAGLFELLIFIARNLPITQTPGNEQATDTPFSFYHILEYIDEHSGEPLAVRELASKCSMSYSHFARLFRENYGRSCTEYINYIRLNKARELLIYSDYDITYIASETGFYDSSHFIHAYKKWRGITPRKERLLARD